MQFSIFITAAKSLQNVFEFILFLQQIEYVCASYLVLLKAFSNIMPVNVQVFIFAREYKQVSTK